MLNRKSVSKCTHLNQTYQVMLSVDDQSLRFQLDAGSHVIIIYEHILTFNSPIRPNARSFYLCFWNRIFGTMPSTSGEADIQKLCSA